MIMKIGPLPERDASRTGTPGRPDAGPGRDAGLGGMARPRLKPADGWLYQAVTSASEIVQAHSARVTTQAAQVVIVTQ